MDKKKYNVALSYASPQQEYVRAVAVSLRDGGFRVFYDEFEKVELWGTYLHESLDTIYRKESERVVIFISKDYLESQWTRVEIRSALSAASASSEIYMLPVRFDSTEIPGLLPSLVHLDAKDYSPAQLADAVTEKIRPPIDPVPRDAPLDNRILWRLTRRRYAADAISGEGAKRFGTRWTSAGRRVVYFASTQSVALLEVAAALRSSVKPGVDNGFTLVSARFSTPVAVSHLYFDYSALAPGWAMENPSWFRAFGDGWLDGGRTAVLSVPSLVVNHEQTLVVNLEHSDSGRLMILGSAAPKLE